MHNECFLQLKELNKQLEASKICKALRHFWIQALRWPFTSKDVESLVARLEKYEQTYTLALQVDQA